VTNLVAAELLKFRTTRAWIGFLLTLAALTGLASAGTVGAASESQFGTSELSRDIVSTALFATLVTFVNGILSVTSEWRHGTVTRTFLVTPSRERVLVAKELWIVLLALVLSAVALVVVLAVSLPWLAFEDATLEVDSSVVGLSGRVFLATILWGALGVGVGALVQNQTVALVGAVIWVLLVEALIGVLFGLVDLDVVADYLPGRALSAFDGTGDEGGISGWAGAGVGLAWVVGLGILGGFRMSRQDVT
jgi:ABC-2 type transport system permease protein